MPFDHIADDVPDQDMHLLDAGGILRRNHDRHATGLFQFPAVPSQQADGGGSLDVRLLYCKQHVRAVARGGQADQYVARADQGLHLALEYAVETVIVTDAGQDRGIGGQRHRGDRPALAFEASDQFGRDVLRVRRTAAVAAPEKGVAGIDAVDQALCRLRNRRQQARLHGCQRPRVFVDRLADKIVHGLSSGAHSEGCGQHAPAQSATRSSTVFNSPTT